MALFFCCALVALHRTVPIVATGDGYGVYFPVVWDLLDGRGIEAFRWLEYGFIRFPAYPLLLFIGNVVFGTLSASLTAVAAIFLACGIIPLFLIVDELISRTAAFFACLFFCISNCAIHMSFASTPDLAAFAVIGWTAYLLWRAPASRTASFAAGVLSALAIFFRLNAIFLVPCGIVATRRRGVFLLGAAIPFVAWIGVSETLRGVLFWLPQGPTEFPNRVFHTDVLPEHDGLLRALRDSPIELIARTAFRILLSGPFEVARKSAWPAASVLALPGLVTAIKKTSKEVYSFGVLVLSSWIAIAPSHFESRYYPVQVACISVAAGWTVMHFATSRRLVQLASFSLLTMIALISAIPRVDGQLALHREASKLMDGCSRLVLAAEGFGAGCLAIEETLYRNAPLRMIMRERGNDRLCCCGPNAEQSSFLKLKGYGAFHPENDPTLERVDVPGTPPVLELYRTVTSTRAL